tara:strand:+ start:117 stop:626 length:510 start_codon:yes stop_codon:yes gene_type:complete
MSILKTNQITDLGGNSIISSNGSGTFTQSFAATTPSFKVTLSGNVTLTNDANVKITFDQETWDIGSGFDTSNSRFTVPSGKAGKYYFFYKGYMGNNLGYYSLKLYKNGSNVSSWTSYHHANSDNTLMDEHTDILDLSVGDYIETYAQTTSGNGTFQSSQSHFGGFRLIT